MPNIISKKDEGTLLMLYNRDGYVLDFSTNAFDVFTTNSIGEALCAKYKLSKGKSLVAYLTSATDANRTKLLRDLFEYYEENMEYEYNKDYQDDFCWGSYSRYNEKYGKLYIKCKAIIENLKGSATVISKTANDLKTKFSSDYLAKQIDLMIHMQTEKSNRGYRQGKRTDRELL